MSNFEMSEWIDRPVKEVFDFISFPPNAAKFIDNIQAGHKLSDGPTRVGTRFSETRVVNGKEATTELEVSEYEPPNTFGILNETMGITVKYIYSFTPESKGTRVNWACELEAGGLKKMMLPMIAGLMKKEDGDHLQKVKNLLEKK